MRIKPKPKENYKIELIREYRRQKKTITEIAKIFGMTRQGVFWYISKYELDKGLDK
jgi:transposase-like protein